MRRMAANGGEWLAGQRKDILYVPEQQCSASIPPVIVDVQNTIDNAFMRRLQSYCNHVYRKYDKVDPITLVLCAKTMPKELADNLQDSSTGSF
ncbi:hypothetical protein BCR43DRAFT_553404 [Syncephalastrum racemosum]|uniref:Uncharacterized protein n=1 Tax=Syncephalastrum racemosum TaxID=13706 RepID=A0A1X2H5F2_SYNRA|nr:hypothetical protein BCR43DRAFT_553404 [Syncephalastrum racemosum]